LYFLEEAKEFHNIWACQTPELHAPHSCTLFYRTVWILSSVRMVKNTIKNGMSEYTKIVKENLLLIHTTSCLNMKSHFETTHNLTLFHPTCGLSSCIYLLGLIQLSMQDRKFTACVSLGRQINSLNTHRFMGRDPCLIWSTLCTVIRGFNPQWCHWNFSLT
jgi:hypothetical protein